MLINLEMVDLPEEVHADLALIDNVHLLQQIFSNLTIFSLIVEINFDYYSIH